MSTEWNGLTSRINLFSNEESVSFEDEGVTKVKEFMAIFEDEPSVGKVDARSGQWVKITMKKVQRLISMTGGDERKHVLDYTHVDLHYVEDQRKKLLNKFNFINQELSSGPKVVFRNNSSDDTEGYGTVNCNEITFTKVAYVNGLKHNLISISQLCDANFKVLFTKTQGTVFNQNNEVVLIAPRRKDFHVIDMSSYNEESNACFFAKASPNVIWLWHKRLSHPCEKGKHHRASFKTKRSFSIKKCLHILYVDLFRLIKPQTISHNKFILVIVDEYFRYTWVFCLKKKSDAADCIMSFIRKMENLNEVRAKELRSDNGTEDHLVKFDEKADDGFFLGYSPMAKAFMVFNIRRQEMEKTYHGTFSEDDEAIFKSSTNGDEINFNENKSFHDDEFLVSRNFISPDESHKFTIADDHPVHNKPNDSKSTDNLEPTEFQESIINEQISESKPSPSNITPLDEVFINPSVPQDRWAREKHWIFRNNIDANSVVIKNKARLVAQGFIQEEGTDYDVTRLEAIRIFLAYAAYMGFMVYQMDVKSAFLNGKISQEVYVKQPPGFESNEFPNYVCKPDKALYELKQAPRAWYLKGRRRVETMMSSPRRQSWKAELHSLKLGYLSIDAYFCKIEFIATISTSLGSPISNDDVVTIDLEGFPDKYENVSGIIVNREPFPDLKMVCSMLTTEEMLLKSRAQATSIDSTSFSSMVLLANSGIFVVRDSSGMFLFQRKYATEILKRAHMVGCNPIRTPVDTKSKLGATGHPICDLILYQSLAGALQYLPFTPPNISYAGHQRQPTLSRSSAEVEYRGVANDVAESYWLRNLLRELHTCFSSAILVYCDNVRVLHVPSRYQYADIFTKGLSSALFEEF
nr:hypothetical protein [Tanacetum cinerariifolium]